MASRPDSKDLLPILHTVQVAEHLVDDAVGHAGGVAAAARAQGLDLVQENDARRGELRLREETAHVRLRLPNIPGSADCLPCYGPDQ